MAKAVKSGKATESIYVIAGKEETLVNAQCSRLLDGLIEPQQRVTGLFSIDGDKAVVSEVLDELRTLPFLADKRVVVIRDADDFVSNNRELLEKYFDNPCPTGILILTVSAWPNNTRLAKKLTQAGKLIGVIQPKQHELPAYCINYAKDAHDKKLDRDAAALLVELAGDDLTRLYSEIDKLALFTAADKTITAGHIESLIGHNRLFDAFEVIDSCLAGNVGAAIERLRKMFAEDKSAEYSAVGAFAYHFRRMFNAKVMLEKGMSEYQISQNLRIWGNKDTLFRQIRKLSFRQIGRQLQHLAETDYEIKTGRAQPKIAIEQLVLRLSVL
jgi:DNA polymerase-3 subunit delta